MAATPTPSPTPAKSNPPTSTSTTESATALTSPPTPSNEPPLPSSPEVSQPVLQPEPTVEETIEVPEAQDSGQVFTVEIEVPAADVVTTDFVATETAQATIASVATEIQLQEVPLADPEPVSSTELTPQPVEQLFPVSPDAITSYSFRDLRKTSIEEYRLFTADHIAGLKPRAMKGLRKQHMLITTVDQLSYFSDAQLRRVKGKRYKLVSLDQFNVIEPLLPSLKAKQLKQLPDYPITQEILDLMSNKQLSALDLF